MNPLERYISAPLRQWMDEKLFGMQEWLKINAIDFIKLVAITIIVAVGLKMFLYYNKKKDIPIIYVTIICYLILRLFWKVILFV